MKKQELSWLELGTKWPKHNPKKIKNASKKQLDKMVDKLIEYTYGKSHRSV